MWRPSYYAQWRPLMEAIQKLNSLSDTLRFARDAHIDYILRDSRTNTLAPCFVPATSASARERATPPQTPADETNADGASFAPKGAPILSLSNQIEKFRRSRGHSCYQRHVSFRRLHSTTNEFLNGRHHGNQEENRCTRGAPLTA